MLYRLKNSIRIQLFLIILTLLILNSILNIFAYLTDSETYSSSFHVASGEEFGIGISGAQYDGKTILPGEEITLNVCVAMKVNIVYICFSLLICRMFLKRR